VLADIPWKTLWSVFVLLVDRLDPKIYAWQSLRIE
jgi:hypothetical protein